MRLRNSTHDIPCNVRFGQKTFKTASENNLNDKKWSYSYTWRRKGEQSEHRRQNKMDYSRKGYSCPPPTHFPRPAPTAMQQETKSSQVHYIAEQCHWFVDFLCRRCNRTTWAYTHTSRLLSPRPNMFIWLVSIEESRQMTPYCFRMAILKSVILSTRDGNHRSGQNMFGEIFFAIHVIPFFLYFPTTPFPSTHTWPAPHYFKCGKSEHFPVIKCAH